MNVLLRAARADELDALSALALRSKGYWGYDAAFLEACRAELTMTPARLDAEIVVVAEATDPGPGAAPGPVGYSSLTVDGNTAELVDLFVDPAAIGSGVGRALWDRAVATARGLGAKALLVEADPNAAPWYERRGAVLVGEVPSGSIPGRMIPHYRLDLGA